MKITVILLTLLYTSIASAGQPYVQPMEPSNDDNVTLLPAPGGKVILDGDAYFSLPDGNKRSLRGLDGTVNDLSERFESNSSKLRYDNMPERAVEDISKNNRNIEDTRKQSQRNKDESLKNSQKIEANRSSLARLQKLDHIYVMTERMYLGPDIEKDSELKCPDGYITLGGSCFMEYKKKGWNYWSIETNNQRSYSDEFNCRRPNPPAWVTIQIVCVDTGMRKVYRYDVENRSKK